MKTLIIINIIAYILSVYFIYDFIKKSYSSIGVFNNNKPMIFDLFINFCPIINIIVMIILFLFFSPYKNEINKRRKRKKILYYIKNFFINIIYKLYI